MGSGTGLTVGPAQSYNLEPLAELQPRTQVRDRPSTWSGPGGTKNIVPVLCEVHCSDQAAQASKDIKNSDSIPHSSNIIKNACAVSKIEMLEQTRPKSWSGPGESLTAGIPETMCMKRSLTTSYSNRAEHWTDDFLKIQARQNTWNGFSQRSHKCKSKSVRPSLPTRV